MRGRGFESRDSKTSKSASLGLVLKAQTTFVPGIGHARSVLAEPDAGAVEELEVVHDYISWAVGRNRISFTSTSSGSLMAKATMRAKVSAGTATSLQ